MTDLLAQLIEAERTIAPPAGAKEATWSALEASIAANVPLPIDLPPPGTSTPIAWIAGIIGGASGLAIVAHLALQPAIEAPAPVRPPPPPPPPIAETIEAPPPAPAEIAAPEKTRKKRRRRKAPKPSLAAQIALLRRAQLAFSSGGAEEALALVQEHRTKFPRTPLEQERSALDALASCRMKRSDARDRAARFLEQWPRSPQADRVRHACLGSSTEHESDRSDDDSRPPRKRRDE